MLASPLEQFDIIPLIELIIRYIDIINISITNLNFYLILLLAAIVSFHLLTLSNLTLVTNKVSLTSESMYATVTNMVKGGIASQGALTYLKVGWVGGIFLPCIYSLLFIIMGANLIGMIPYSLCITAQFALCLSFSFAILIGVTLLGVHLHRLKFLSLFVPSGTPLGLVPMLVIIELISYIARALSLGIRLAANMIAGHVLLKILSSSIWKALVTLRLLFVMVIIPIGVGVLTLFIGLELAVAFLQAYVFTLLTISYHNDVINLH